LVLGTFLYSESHRPPDAVVPATILFAFVVVPFVVILFTMTVMIAAIHYWWRMYGKYAGSQEITLTEQAISLSGTDGSGVLPWSAFKYYKETPWAFLFWHGSVWMMLPKRAFTSWDDLIRCREVLDQRLEHSRWFIG
jgi:hypothetical protein